MFTHKRTLFCFMRLNKPFTFTNKKKFLILLPFILMFCFIGCTPTHKWKNQYHNDESQLNRDRAECDMFAQEIASSRSQAFKRQQYANANQALVAGVLEGVTQGLTQALEFNNCMKARGYYREKITNETQIANPNMIQTPQYLQTQTTDSSETTGKIASKAEASETSTTKGTEELNQNELRTIPASQNAIEPNVNDSQCELACKRLEQKGQLKQGVTIDDCIKQTCDSQVAITNETPSKEETVIQTTQTIEERLESLKKLQKKGLITKKEYQKKRKELIDGI